MVGVSTDRQETSDRFARELELQYRLVGDPEGRIAGAWDVRWPVVRIAKRVTYAVGRDRRIMLAFRSERDVAAHLARAAEAVGAPLA